MPLVLPSPTSVFSNPWGGKQWTALGTSITSLGQYTAPLATLLAATLNNQGVSGASASSSSSFGPSGIYNKVATVPASADLVTVEAGINDFRGNAALGVLGDTTTATFYGALYRIGADLLAGNASRTVVFLTPYGNTDNLTAANWLTANTNGVKLDAFVQAVKDVGHRLGCAVIDVGGESGLGGATAAIYTGDGVHPSQAGGLRMAQFIYDRLLTVRPRTAITNTFNLHAATLGELSGSGLTVNSLAGGTAGSVGVTQLAAYTSNYSALWLATGANTAAEFTVVNKGGATTAFLWILTGEGASGWSGIGDFSDANPAKNGTFTAAAGALTINTAAPRMPLTNPAVNVIGQKWRIARNGNFVQVLAFNAGTGLFDTACTWFDASSFGAGWYETSKLGILINAPASNQFFAPGSINVGTNVIS